jgi:hypothetical protein
MNTETVIVRINPLLVLQFMTVIYEETLYMCKIFYTRQYVSTVNKNISS